MNNQLTLSQPAELVRQSTDIAQLCKEIVVASAVNIQGRKYVRAEGWQSIATAHGCLASSRDVERVEGGYRAIGEVRRMNDGALLASAEGFVGEDEPTWFGGGPKNLPKRPDYAIRAMCQTRAISRACRSAFAHVVVLMDAGLSTTPAEEVPQGGFQDDHAPAEAREEGTLTNDPVPRMYWAKKETAGPEAALDWLSESYNGLKVNVRKTDAGWRVVVFGIYNPTIPVPVNGTMDVPLVIHGLDDPGAVRIHFGKNRGLMLSELTRPQFQWYAEEWAPKREAAGHETARSAAAWQADLALITAVKAYGAILSGPTVHQKPQSAPEVSGQPNEETASWKAIICHLGIKGAKGMALGVLDGRHMAEIRAKMAEKEKLGTRNLSAADRRLAAALLSAQVQRPVAPPADDEPPAPWFTGKNHENLSNLLSFEKISEDDFMATAHDQKWLTAEVETFGMLPEDKVQQFCDNFADVIEGVRVYREARK